MSHERLAALILARQEALLSDEKHSITHEAILSILKGLDRGDFTEGQALRFLGYQALRWADVPAYAALYRQAAADIRQMQREEH
jgi:hypothetical protein